MSKTIAYHAACHRPEMDEMDRMDRMEERMKNPSLT